MGPFDEFSFRWYVLVGPALILTLLIQLVSPHIGLFCRFFYLNLVRWYDRGFSSNMRKTR